MSWRTTRASDAGRPGHHQVAIIDLGSNSWRLVVFSYGDGPWWKRTDELYETVRIGAGLQSTGQLGEQAMARGIETISVFGRFCRANKIPSEHVHAVATSAIRDAANGAAFLAEATWAGQMEIEVLSATDEAHYGYVAAINTTTLRDGVVLDIGGGSLQLTAVHDRQAGPSASFPLGAVRITEQLLSADRPAKKKELARVRARVDEALESLDWLAASGDRLVGMGGAVRNLAASIQGLDTGLDLGVQGFVIEPEALSELVARLAALPPDERGAVPGIKPGRGDIILASALVLEAVVQRGGFHGLEATEAGLREGLFLGRTLLAGQEPRLENVRVAAVRNLAIQYESDLVHVEHVATLALQMFDSLDRRSACSSPPKANASCCGRRRCCTTSA